MIAENLYMTTAPHQTCYLLIIKTNNQVNCERELTALLTDAVGDCGIGDDWTSWYDDPDDIYEEESENYLEVLQVPNDYGCYRPCCIGTLSYGRFDTIIIFFTNPDDAKIAQERLNGGYREEELTDLKTKYNFEVEESKVVKYIVDRFIEENYD